MSQRTLRRIITIFALGLVSATVLLAQSPISPEAVMNRTSNSWQAAQSFGSSRGRLYVVTFDRPQHRQSCRVQSFTAEKLVCSRGIGVPRTYRREQIVALILPGDQQLKLRLLGGLNGGLAAAIWGTVVLAATCPVCAAATAFVALLIFGAAGAVLIGDDEPDWVLYLAPGQHLSSRLHALQG